MQKLNSKGSITLLILFMILFLFPSFVHSANSERDWLQGYRKKLKGGTIEYHSAQPDVTKALLVRSINAEDYIAWETEPIPEDYRGERPGRSRRPAHRKNHYERLRIQVLPARV